MTRLPPFIWKGGGPCEATKSSNKNQPKMTSPVKSKDNAKKQENEVHPNNDKRRLSVWMAVFAVFAGIPLLGLFENSSLNKRFLGDQEDHEL